MSIRKKFEYPFSVRVQKKPALDVQVPSDPGFEDWEGSKYDEKKIERSLREERGVEIFFYQSSSRINDYILRMFRKAAAVTGCPFEMEPIAMIVGELVQNGLKANFKKAYFRTKQINHKDTERYKEGLQVFKRSISTQTRILSILAYRDRLFVRVQIFPLHSNCIKLRVINSAPLYEIEKERIRDKLNNAEKYDNLVEFFMDTRDETEGAGLGMLVIVLSLRDLGLSPNHFTVFQGEREETVASVLFSW